MRAAPLAARAAVLLSTTAWAQEFTYNPPGQLESGSSGYESDTVFVPGMRFPLESAPAYANSQVWGIGGMNGPAGSQCSDANYSYPWSDNFCEPRSWDVPLCPGGTGHQGQDIRPATCEDDVHWAVAAEAGTITSIGSYSVYLVADSGVRHRYLHMSPASVQVSVGDRVPRGQRLGRISAAFFDSNGSSVPTTIHLHYDIHMHVESVGAAVYAPPYMSLVRAYEELVPPPAPCPTLPPEGGIIDDEPPCFETFGPETYWRRVEDRGVGGSMHWTNAWDSVAPSNWARWSVAFEQGGDYLVEANVVPPYNRSRRTPYRVRASGAEHLVTADLSLAEGWMALGMWRFQAGGDQHVDVLDNSGETESDLHISADAIRLTRVWGPEPTDAGVGSDSGTAADTAPAPGRDPGTQGGSAVDSAADTAAGPGSQPPVSWPPTTSDQPNPPLDDMPADQIGGAGQPGPPAEVSTGSSGCGPGPAAPSAPLLAVLLLGLWLRPSKTPSEQQRAEGQ